MYDQSHYKVDNAPSNPHYQQDIHYTLDTHPWVLKPIGIWPLVYNRTSNLEKIVSIILIPLCVFILLFSLIPPSRYIFVEDSLYKQMKLFGPVVFGLASAIKYCYLCFKGAIFKRCIVHVKDDWKTVGESDHRAIMLRQASISKNLIALCIGFLYTSGMSYTTVMPFLSKSSVKGNISLKPLIYPGYDAFFDTQSSPTYEIIFSIHCFCSFIEYTITTAAYSLAAIFVTHICGQIQIQIARLNNLTERESKGDEVLNVIIREHMEILRLSKNVEKALREICFTEIVQSTVIICLLEYYCLMEWQNSDAIAIITYFMLLISFTFNIFIFCFVGQNLTDQCRQIGPASYGIDWYNLPPKKARYVILLSVISLHPPKLTAGKLIKLNLITFSSVIKSSVVYLNLLRKFTV